MSQKKPRSITGLTAQQRVFAQTPGVDDTNATTPKPGRVQWATTTVRLRPEQKTAINRLAFERAEQGLTSKPDSSEIIREAIDAYLGLNNS